MMRPEVSPDPVAEQRPDATLEPVPTVRRKRTTLRLVIDTLIALMLVAILGMVVWNYRREWARQEQTQQVFRALAELQKQTLLQSTQPEIELSEEGFPKRIDPEWFQILPRNVALEGAHPWLDVAPPGDFATHPPDPVATEGKQAGFWYNPQRGIFRARVPDQLVTAKTLALYNFLNGVELTALPIAPRTDRNPLPNPEVSFAETREAPAPTNESPGSQPRRSLRTDASQ